MLTKIAIFLIIKENHYVLQVYYSLSYKLRTTHKFIINNRGFMVFATVNTDDMEDMAYDYILERELDGNEDRWDEEEWGFYDELSVKSSNEKAFDTVEETGIETVVLKTDKNFNFFFDYASKQADAYFNANGNEITLNEWRELVGASDGQNISICECSPF